MADYRKILRLLLEGRSYRDVVEIVGCSHRDVALSCCGYLGQWALLKWGVTESRDQHDRIAEKIYPGVQ
ncbi:hypothetical protein, partial [Cryobacterium sp. TMS1-20-1]|uniref:hypothetical protein n=1 Tax=Cryobacterium sp. TMS1-20-1 TaxID=1259223 RepID=UPI001A7E1432